MSLSPHAQACVKRVEQLNAWRRQRYVLVAPVYRLHAHAVLMASHPDGNPHRIERSVLQDLIWSRNRTHIYT